MRFVYSLIRFVPDPARGEFVNVGAIVGSDESSEWQSRQIENTKRARALDDGSLLDAVWSFMDRIGTEIDKYTEGFESLFGPSTELSENWLEALYTEHRNIVQLSRPAPMVATSADEALDVVFEQMILDPATSREPGHLSKTAAMAALRQAFLARNLRTDIDVRERVKLSTTHHSGVFDFAVTNGKAVQIAQTWSFQIADQPSLTQQVRAWGWIISDLRSGGGRISTRLGKEFELDANVDIEVVYVPPAAGQEAPALDDARGVFDVLEIEAHPYSEAPKVAQRAEELLTQAGVRYLPS